MTFASVLYFERNGEIIKICMGKKRFLLQFKDTNEFSIKISLPELLSVVLSPIWFLERFSAISVSFCSIDFSIYIPTQGWVLEAGSAEGKQPLIPFILFNMIPSWRGSFLTLTTLCLCMRRRLIDK